MNARTKPTRGDVGLAEATRDPIFLLQFRTIRIHDLPVDHTYDDDTETIRTFEGEDNRKFEYSIREYAEAFSDCVFEDWRTESVWFTRSEAVAWMESHAYRWPDGMRVYCVCAEGELAAILKDHSLKPTGNLEPCAPSPSL